MFYGTKLRHTRERIGIKQKDFASELNLSNSLYCKYESEYQIIPIKYLIEAVNILDVSIDYIFDNTEQKQYKNIKKEIDRKIINQRLKEFRKNNGLTQLELSKILKIGKSTVAEFERGRNLISTGYLYKISKDYKISADYILGRIDKNMI